MTSNYGQKHDSVSNACDTTQRPMSKEVQNWLEMEERIHQQDMEMLRKLLEEKQSAKTAARESEKQSEHVTPVATLTPEQRELANEEPPAKGLIGKVKAWLNAQNNVSLWAFSKYFPVGCLVCATPGNVFSFGGNALEFIATALFYAFIAFVFTEVVDHILGKNATNLRCIQFAKQRRLGFCLKLVRLNGK